MLLSLKEHDCVHGMQNTGNFKARRLILLSLKPKRWGSKLPKVCILFILKAQSRYYLYTGAVGRGTPEETPVTTGDATDLRNFKGGLTRNVPEPTVALLF